VGEAGGVVKRVSNVVLNISEMLFFLAFWCFILRRKILKDQKLDITSSFLILEIIFALIVLKIPNLFDSPKL